MATQRLTMPRFWKSTQVQCPFTVGGPEETWVVEAASQTYKKGQMVYWDTSGHVAICTQSTSIMTSEILGFATQDGENGSAGVPTTRVNVIRMGDILVANVWNAAGDAVSAKSQLGDVFGLTLVNPTSKAAATATTDVWAVDLDNTTIEDLDESEARCRVVGFPTGVVNGVQSAIGDIFGFVLIQILPYSIASDGTPHQRILQIL